MVLDEVKQGFSSHSSNLTNVSIGKCPSVELDDTEVQGSSSEVQSLANADNFEASDSSFSAGLSFGDNEKVTLQNCSVPDITSTGSGIIKLKGWEKTTIDDNGIPHTPHITVSGSGKVLVYHWLTVKVSDNESNPLEGASVEVVHDLTGELVAGPRETNEDGEAVFELLATDISSKNEVFEGSYKVRATYGDMLTEILAYVDDETETNMVLDVKKEDDDEGLPWLMYIIIIVVALFLIVLLMALSRGSGGSSRNRSKGRKRR